MKRPATFILPVLFLILVSFLILSNEAGYHSLIISQGYRGADMLRDLNPLSIAKIKIGAKWTPSDPELLPTVRRVGTQLLGMLCAEYEHRRTIIGDLSVGEANARLKEQLKKYIKGVYPSG